MAGIAFSSRGSMVRPGVYNRYVQTVSTLYAGASDGIVACVLGAQWGNVGAVYEIDGLKKAKQIFGGECALLREVFTGGASTVYAVRAGSGGSKGAYILCDTNGAQAVRAAAQCVGARKLALTIAEGNSGTRACVISEDGSEKERMEFKAGTGEAQALISAAAQSEYCTFTLVDGYSGDGTLKAVENAALSGGQDPTLSSDDYADALDKLTAYAWNCVCADDTSDGVRAALLKYMRAAADEGHMGFAVVGEGVDVPYARRIEHAAAINDYRMVFVGGGWYEGDELIDGCLSAARIAGMIARVPSDKSLTHRTISNASRCAEALTHARYSECALSGMLTFSTSPTGAVWVENAITALSNPEGEDDEGWKKIKRARIRFELMDRASATVSPMVGNVSNDPDGRAAVIQALEGLLRAMISEGKLLAGATVETDPDAPPEGDSASFIIEADDVDALEKVYFTYRFSFS